MQPRTHFRSANMHRNIQDISRMSRIVVYGEQAHPILSLVELNLRSKKKDYFNHLKNIASHHGLASLSAVQLGESYSIFVMLRKHFLQDGKWLAYERTKQTSYCSYINPKIDDLSEETVSAWQQCSSYPNVRFMISRSVKVKLIYEDEDYRDRQSQLVGFPAVICQHELGHFENMDLLKISQRLEITNPALQKSHGSEIQQLYAQYQEAKRLKQQNQASKFALLRRELIYEVLRPN